MPVFFEMRSTAEPLMRRRNADALAEILQDSLKPFDVRVVSIRKTASHGFVYGCAARQRPNPGALVERLRADRRLAKFRFSDESGTSDGPFASS
jgi:hypothetical protein